MNKAQEAIIEFFERAMVSLNEADYQEKNRKDFLELLEDFLKSDKEELLAKYADE